MKMLNKSGLISGMSKRSGLNKKDSTMGLDAILNTIKSALAKKQGIRLIGFGNFKVNHRKARKGHNPATGKSMMISARDIPSFKAGMSLKNKVNK